MMTTKVYIPKYKELVKADILVHTSEEFFKAVEAGHKVIVFDETREAYECEGHKPFND